jgi:hypothetical protein
VQNEKFCPKSRWIPAKGGSKHKKRNIEIALFVFIVCGAEGETRKVSPALLNQPTVIKAFSNFNPNLLQVGLCKSYVPLHPIIHRVNQAQTLGITRNHTQHQFKASPAPIEIDTATPYLPGLPGPSRWFALWVLHDACFRVTRCKDIIGHIVQWTCRPTGPGA